MSTVWPRSSPPRSNSACHAVRPATGSAAACSTLIPAGRARDDRGGRDGELRVGAARDEAEDLVARGEALGVRHLDRSRHVAAEHGRQLLRDQALPVLPVDRVDAHGVDPDQHRTLPGDGLRELLELENLGPPGSCITTACMGLLSGGGTVRRAL